MAFAPYCTDSRQEKSLKDDQDWIDEQSGLAILLANSKNWTTLDRGENSRDERYS